MSPEPFEKLLGQKAKNLSDVFNSLDSQTQILLPHHGLDTAMINLMGNCLINPEARSQVLKSVKEHGGVFRVLSQTASAGISVFNALSRNKDKQTNSLLASQDDREGVVSERMQNSYTGNLPTRDEPKKPPLIKEKLGKQAYSKQEGFTVVMADLAANREAVQDSQLLLNKGTVVIIGGRSQLGRALTDNYLVNGWNVVVTTQKPSYQRKEGSKFHELGGINLNDAKTATVKYWEKKFNEIQESHGKIHTVINCAGVSVGSELSIENINKRPVGPMFQAAVNSGIKQFTQISTKAAAIDELCVEGSYSGSKRGAEEALRAIDKNGANLTIVRSDLLVSGNDPGHWGGPQGMAGSSIKVTSGVKAETAGETRLSPLSTNDLADALRNVSEKDIKTPNIITASGPKEYKISELLDVFRGLQGKRFALEVQLTVAALLTIAEVLPRDAFEPNHLKLLEYYDKNPPKVDQDSFNEFTKLVGRKLTTVQEEILSYNRPSFIDPDLPGYTIALSKKVNLGNVLPLTAAVMQIATQSRINSDPHREHRSPDDGVSSGSLLLLLAGAVAVAVLKNMAENAQKEDKKKDGGEGASAKEINKPKGFADQFGVIDKSHSARVSRSLEDRENRQGISSF